ncbi:iron-siderophore ABC transporter substrate-binding protein [Leucobacter massiliensis]|uniref:iron-siderophore ABC transporter substrate-binding protein n=1 Tax=Leucobacter massiliensis TaxID=1686285 RepID=UPI0015E3C343|nr:iron-siderophore ABC transporter substrate-binding protein [Leucobacter massiliensis]
MALIALSSCATGAATDTAAQSAASHEGFPVTIEHKLGETTISEPPTRVASVGIGDTDILLALGVQPVLAPVWNGSTDTGVGEWAMPLVTGDAPTPLESGTSEFSIEKVAASDPDVIVAVNNAIDETRYQQLSSIAPTVLHSADETDWVLPWQSLTRQVGTAVGKATEAEKLVAETEALMKSTAEKNSDLAGLKAALVVVWDDDTVSVFSNEAARGQLVDSLGFEFPENLRSADNALRFDLSAENLSELNSLDVLFVDNWDKRRAQLENMPTFHNLDVVREGNVIGLDAVTSDAVSMPNPVTIPYVLDRFVSQIRETPAGTEE